MSKRMGKAIKRSCYRREIRWLDGRKLKSPRFPPTIDGKAAADHWYEQRAIQKKMVSEGVEAIFSPRLLEDFSKEWIKDRVTEVEEVTWREEMSKLRLRILPSFGKRQIHTLRTGEVKEWLKGLLKEGLHPTSVDHYRAVLNKLLNDAIKHDPPHLKENPVGAIRKFSKYDFRKKPDVWNESQCQKYLAAAKALGPTVYLGMMWYVNTGARQSEIIALRHRDIDLDRKQFTIRRVREHRTGKFKERTKSGKERTLGMNDSLLAAYRERRRGLAKDGAPPRPDDLVLTTTEGGPWGSSSVYWWHSKCVEAAKLPWLSPHGLRHTFASLFAMKSGNLRTVQGMLGHASSQMTERYTHFLPGYLATQASVVQVNDKPARRPKRKGGAK